MVWQPLQLLDILLYQLRCTVVIIQHRISPVENVVVGISDASVDCEEEVGDDKHKVVEASCKKSADGVLAAGDGGVGGREVWPE